MSLPDYRRDSQDMLGELEPCPRCGSNDVGFTNSRDLNILKEFIACESCHLMTFQSETVIFIDPPLPNKDWESTFMKYNAWCKTNPKSYHNEKWELES